MKLPALTLPKESLARLGGVIAQEWLITNGLGSYASSTVPGINTRKYHGLLVAALNPPGDRTVCLAKLDEDIAVGDSMFRLGSTEFRDAIFPDATNLLHSLRLTQTPTITTTSAIFHWKKQFLCPKRKTQWL
jgi:predicted glycogen debranching enzyme